MQRYTGKELVREKRAWNSEKLMFVCGTYRYKLVPSSRTLPSHIPILTTTWCCCQAHTPLKTSYISLEAYKWCVDGWGRFRKWQSKSCCSVFNQPNLNCTISSQYPKCSQEPRPLMFHLPDKKRAEQIRMSRFLSRSSTSASFPLITFGIILRDL